MLGNRLKYFKINKSRKQLIAAEVAMAAANQINFYFLLSCIVGIALSSYALVVGIKKEKLDDYEAYCDISEHMSCSRAFSSKYGKGFGIIGSIFGEDSAFNQSNSIIGIIFYYLLAMTSFNNNRDIIKFQIFLCIISNILSVYLAYILLFILKNCCLICVATYVVNAVNLILLLYKKNIVNVLAHPPQHTTSGKQNQKMQKID